MKDVIFVAAICVLFGWNLSAEKPANKPFYGTAGTSVVKKCLMHLTFDNTLKSEHKEYCLNPTDGNGKVVDWDAHDADVMSCVLGYSPCKATPKETPKK